MPSEEEFEKSLDEAQEWAASVGLTEDDINDIKAIINGGTPFMVKGAKEKWLEVKNQICSKHTET